MLCEECGEREAQVLVTTVVNGETTRLHLCRECVKKYQTGGNISALLAAILSSMAKAHEAEDKTCPKCGMTLAEFRRGGMLGCTECYQAFHSELTPLLNRIHGRNQHAGHRPPSDAKKQKALEEIASMRAEMNRAVADERYEEAAVLRDRIRELNEKMTASDGEREKAEETEKE